MSNIVRTIHEYWRLAFVCAAGMLGLFALRNDIYKDVTQELIALFGLMIAAVLPAMVLTASSLKSGYLSVKKLDSYENALLVQIRVWIGLFVVSLSGSFFVIIGKIAGWAVPVSLSLSAIGGSVLVYDLIHFINAMITACLGLVVIRGLDVGHGIVSLLKLSAEIALSEAKARDEERFKAGDEAIEEIQERPGYGDYVPIKPPPRRTGGK